MSRKTKNKSKEKKSRREKFLERRTDAIASLLKKLQRISKKIIVRQKRAKGRGKRLAKDQKGLQKRLNGVETQVGKQLQRIRELAKKNSSIRERLKKQARITKDNCARLDKFEPSLTDSRQRSQHLDNQISNLLGLIESIRDHSEDLQQGLASLELKVNQQIEHPELPVAPTSDPGPIAESQAEEEALPPQLFRLEGSLTEAHERADEQTGWLEKLQTRLEVLENDYTSLEEGNRGLVHSIEALSDREQELGEQNSRIIEQGQTLEAGQAEQQNQIGSLNDQVSAIRNRVEKLADDMPDNRRLRNRDAELQQQLDSLQRSMEALKSEHNQAPGGLSESIPQKLYESGDRELLLRQQIDQLGGLLVTTEGKLSEKNARLGLEHARLAEQVQQLEQRLTEPKKPATEPETQELKSLKELNRALQRRLEEIADREEAQKQQVDHLRNLLKTTDERLIEQDAQLELTNGRLAEQSQRVEQRLATLDGTIDERLTKEHRSLQELSSAMQQQLRAASDSEKSLGQQIDHLGNLLSATEGKLGEQSADVSSLSGRLTEQADRLVGLEGTVTKQQAQELASLKELSENLQRQLRESDGREQSLSQRVNDLDGLLATTGDQLTQQRTILTKQTSGLASGQQAIETRQKRLVGSLLAGGVLVLALVLAGYWLNGQRIAENQVASNQQIEEIRQQILSQGQPLGKQQEPSESSAGLDKIRTRMTLLESRLENQDQQFALGGGEPIEEKAFDPIALEKLRQILAEQKRWISNHQSETDKLRATLGQLETAQQETEKSLQQLQDSYLKAVEFRQGSAKNQPEEAASEISSDELKGVSWLRGLSPDHYTIQLVAAHNKGVIEQVAAGVESTEGLATYKRQYQGRDWYVLLYGDFQTREQALSAGSELPGQIKAFKPWVRRLSWVHRDLTNH